MLREKYTRNNSVLYTREKMRLLSNRESKCSTFQQSTNKTDSSLLYLNNLENLNLENQSLRD